MAVVAPAGKVESETEAEHPGGAGPRQGQAAVRRMAGVVQVERLAAAIARDDAVDLERGDVRDRELTPVPVDDEFDRPEFDAAKIANQMLADQPGRAARLAADDRRERLAPGRVGTVVDHPSEQPIAVSHDPPRADQEGEFASGEIDGTKAALVDPERHDRDAVVMGRRTLRVRIDARTQIVAIAALHVFA